jgi:tetratricopeptide (TPR) repeat protein
MPKDFYAVLALPRNATEDQLRQRFRDLARERHPDRFRGEEKLKAEKEFQEITQAFNVLADPDRRRQHDMDLARPQEPGGEPRQVSRAYLQRGIKSYREKNFFDAADNFDRATRAEPGNAQAWHHLALACSRQPSWLSRALSAIDSACELEPMNPAYLKLAGRLHATAGDLERAERCYQEALVWGGEDDQIRHALEELKRTPRRSFFGKTG